MPETFRCTHGHEWTADPSNTSPTCPVCASIGETPWMSLLATGGERAAPDPALPEIPGYALLRKIGKGGMGVVYHARHLALGREVALKVILAAEHALPEELLRFLAEAETVARLQHPHIVPIYDVGEASGRPFFTMELLGGGSLRQRLASGPMPERETAELLVKLARAAHHAHTHGIVHRDLKPDNVLLSADGTPKVTDFGLAKRLTGGAGLTATGAILGTPAYMAPEQASHDRAIGPPADVYALGAILYECLTGRPPFSGGSIADTLLKVVTEEPTPPARLRSGVSRDLETICLKCLEKDPGQRYASAAELADDLERYLSHRPIRARRTPLLERAWKWRRRHPTAAVLLLLAFLLLVGSAVVGWLYYDRFVRVHLEYYATWTKRWGSYEGIGRLTAEQVRNRPYSYRFHVRAGKVERVDVVDARGELAGDTAVRLYIGAFETPNPTSSRMCYYRFERDASGRVTDEVGYDRNDREVMRFHYTSPSTASFTDGRGYPLVRAGSGAAYVEFTRNEQGQDAEIRYRDREQRPRPDPDGAFGRRMEFNERGLVTRVTLLDAEGRPFRIATGYATLETEYDDMGNSILSRYLDETGRPTWHKDGYASVRRTYDTFGRIEEEVNLDMAGKPVRTRSGVIRLRAEYTGPEDYVVQYLDAQGRPDRPWETATGWRHDTLSAGPEGRIIKLTALDEERPVRLGTWVAGWVEEDDADGRALERSYFGPDGKPTFHSDGYVREVMKYDEEGNLKEWQGYDAEKRLIRNDSWYARMTCRYDVRGRRIEEAYFDPDGKLTLHRDGYARKRTAYDTEGKVESIEYFDTRDRPTRCSDLYSRVSFTYDVNGFVAEERYFAPDGSLTWHKKGYAILRKVNDARGNVVERTSQAPDGKPVLDWDSKCKVRAEYDAWGNPTRETWTAPDGRPILESGRVAYVERTFDRLGRLLTMSCFGLKGERALRDRGDWQERFEYDDRGHLRRDSYHDADGKLVEAVEGAAEYRQEFNAHGKLVKVTYLGADGKPARGRQVVRIDRDYDDRGLLTREVRFDAGDKVLTGFVQDNDARGWPVARRHLGPVEGTGMRWLLDDRGLIVEETYHDAKGNPIPLVGSVFKRKQRHDARGNLREESHHDRDGKLTAGPQQYARIVMEVDDRDHKTLQKFFGPDNAPCVHAEGNAATVFRYNDIDQQTEHTFLDRDGRPMVLKQFGYARSLGEYDGHGNLVKTEYQGPDGKPMNGPKGFARRTRTYELDRPTSSAYFDSNGKELRPRVVVRSVVPGSVADRMGIRVDDVFTHYDGKEVSDVVRFSFVRDAEPVDGPKRTLRVLRAGKPLEFALPPGKIGMNLDDVMPEPGK